MTTLSIYRPPSTLVKTIDIDEKTIFYKKLMGEHRIVCNYISTTALTVTIGDYITYDSENYYINRLPEVIKINNSTFSYIIVFEGSIYELGKKLFISSDGLAEYTYNGTPTDFVTNIVASINEIGSGWTVGTVDTADEQTLHFSNESCRAALNKVAEAFDMEYEISGKSISLKTSIGTTTAVTFEYGKELGLYKLSRQQVQDQNIITKVYGFGGTQNIPYTYRNGAQRLIFAASGMAASGVLISAASGTYGVIEGQYTDDDIYPQRTSTLTAVNMVFDYGAKGTDFNPKTSYIEDSAMDFDLNDYLIEGSVAKTVFKSGDLSGLECEIWKYDNANKRFYINAYSDQDGYTAPNQAGVPASGDSYTLVGISMPQSYVDTAESALKVATQAYLDENCVPMVVYSVDIDQKYAKSISLDLNTGDKVTIVDSHLNIDSLIRVSAIEFPLVNPYKIKAVIADFVPYTLEERVIKNIILTKKEKVFVDRKSAELARRNTMRQNQLRTLLFDTDGYFDETNIKPLSIETAYLAVGTKSRDFWLSNVTIKANYNSDANRLYVSAGSLIHLQLSITGLGYTWVIGSALDQSSLTPASAYYLYAKCSKSALTGEWVLSASQITVEQVAGYYHFLVGMLFVVADGYRDFDFVYGMTYINGNTITTGKIQSIDANNYIDLTNNKFRIGGAASGFMDWNVSASGVLTLNGALVSDLIMSEYGTINNLKVEKVEGVALGDGDLAGSVFNTQGSYAGLPEIHAVTFTTGTDGTADLSCDGIVREVTFIDSFAQTAIEFAADAGNISAFAASGIALSNYGNSVRFTKNTAIITPANITNTSGTLDGSGSVVQEYDPPVARIDTVTLTGASGMADILCDGLTKSASFISSLEDTATAFVASYAADYLIGGVVASASGVKVIFTANVPGVDFTGSTTINHVTNLYKGAIKIEGNHIWEDVTDDDYCAILINYKGYQGGISHKRATIIGNGKGHAELIVSDGSVFCVTKLTTNGIDASLPGSDPHVAGRFWQNGGDVKISLG